MIEQRRRTSLWLLAAVILLSAGLFAQTDQETVDLAKKTQNPISDMISLPFQNNTNFGIGPHDRTQNVLNIQSVVPFKLSEKWNLITRTIVPVISQPDIVETSGSTFGISDNLNIGRAEGFVRGFDTFKTYDYAGADPRLPTFC